MVNPFSSIDCAQARESSSAGLDGELPELDRVRLGAHLRGCAACRAYAEGLVRLTTTLREAPLEQPVTPLFAARPRRLPAAAAAAAAAIVVVAAGSSFALGRALGTGHAARPASDAASQGASAQADSTLQHLLAISRLQASSVETQPARPGEFTAI